jgi:Lysyl oxidase
MGRVRVVRTALPVVAAAVVLGAGALPAGGQVTAPPEPPPGSPPDREPVDENPCIGPQAAQLRCPDFVMRRPYGLYTDRLTKAGSTVLRAGNVIDSIGAGPAELRGRRVSRRFMDARQRIHRRDGGIRSIDTNARLEFKFAHQQRYWWKFHDAARFELWRVDSRGRRTVKVRTGPKVAYCLRDLTRTRPTVRRSPRRRVYPACSTNPRAQSVIVGTSPGWADIYPPAYPEQWIDVTGLRGCFAYVHIADPENGIYESNEDNNEAQAIVRLPFRADRRRSGCSGEDRGRGFDPRGDYYSPPG